MPSLVHIFNLHFILQTGAQNFFFFSVFLLIPIWLQRMDEALETQCYPFTQARDTDTHAF